MFKNLLGNHFARLTILGVIAVVLAAIFLATTFRQPAQAAQQAAPNGPLAVFTCNVNQVAIFNNVGAGRVHVRCSNSYNDSGTIISYWAYSASDSAGASRYLSLFATAQATGNTVTLYFTPGDTSGSVWGCGSGDCRRIWGATVP
jgi:hypothetical protein